MCIKNLYIIHLITISLIILYAIIKYLFISNNKEDIKLSWYNFIDALGSFGNFGVPMFIVFLLIPFIPQIIFTYIYTSIED